MKTFSSQSTKWISLTAAAAILTLVVSTVGCTRKSEAAASIKASAAPQKTFNDPSEAGQALQAASRANDNGSLAQILGSGAKPILSSGDPAEDMAALQSFVAQYDQMNRWVTMTDGSRILYIGADDYPFPIPLVKDGTGRWYFNTVAGQNEILARRIGRNELLAIDAASAIANAEELYVHKSRDGNSREYTSNIISTPGTKDGLYWPIADGEKPSPLGRVEEFAPDAITSASSAGPVVFDGYQFRILTTPGKKSERGFTIIASPVKYGDSGIMSFMLSREGVVYQQDLGPNTAQAATIIASYDPSAGWTQVE